MQRQAECRLQWKRLCRGAYFGCRIGLFARCLRLASECSDDHTAAELQLLSLRLLLAAVGDAELTVDELPVLFSGLIQYSDATRQKGSTFKALACRRASWYPSAPPGNEGHT